MLSRFRLQKVVVAATLAIGAALMAGGLVQVYYSGLAPETAWSPAAVYAFLGIMFLFVAWLILW